MVFEMDSLNLMGTPFLEYICLCSVKLSPTSFSLWCSSLIRLRLFTQSHHQVLVCTQRKISTNFIGKSIFQRLTDKNINLAMTLCH